MPAKYLFRLDDIAENLNWNNYSQLKELLLKYEIKPILGVIPDNKDPELKSFPLCPVDFWEEVRSLQKVGWEIAIHGYQHKFETYSKGLLGINPQSEFAGLSFEQQYEKIKAAKKIFQSQQVYVRSFMAPAHSLDMNTLKALKKAGIKIITDGYGVFPYPFADMTFVPQLFASPRTFPYGIYTFCIHPNLLSFSQLEQIKRFLENNKDKIISLQRALDYVTDSKLNLGIGRLIRLLLKVKRISDNWKVGCR